MKILDLFAGTGSSTQAFADRGHTVIRVELDPQHEAELHADVLSLTPMRLLEVCGGTPDFIWASPPCTAFSVASIGRHWANGGKNPTPKTQQAEDAQRLVAHTLSLIHALNPQYWLMENPRGMLRKLALVQPYTRRTVTYCQYGDERMKPTDLRGPMPDTWFPKPPCKNGDTCHVSAPRGATTGTQGRKGAVARSRVPYALSLDICCALEAQEEWGDDA